MIVTVLAAALFFAVPFEARAEEVSRQENAVSAVPMEAKYEGSVDVAQSLLTSGSQGISTTKTEHYIFAVPEKGWSCCEINISYCERYLTYNSFITFNQRERSYYADFEYSSECPRVLPGNVSHYYPSGVRRRTFTSWSTFPAFFPGGYDEYSSTMNSSSESYENHTGNYGSLPYIVTCNGGYPRSYADSLTLSLESN